MPETSRTLGAAPAQLECAERLLLLVLAGVQFTHIMDFMIMMPLGPQLMRLFEISPQQFGFIVSAYTFSAGLFGFLGAFVIDRFDRKRALFWSYLGFALGTLACAIAPSYFFLMMARAFAGAFGGVMSALIFSIVGDAIPSQRRGRAMGIVMASFSVASVFGVPFGLWLATLYTWHAPFLFLAAVAALNLVIIALRVPSLTKHLHPERLNRTPLQILAGIAQDRNQLIALAFTALLMLSQFVMIPFLSAYMVSNVGFQESELPYIYLIGGGLTIFTSPLIGRLADRMGRAKVFTAAGLFLLLPYGLISHMGPTPLPLALLVTTFFFVCGNGRFIPAMAIVTSTVRPETRGSFMSINSSVQSLSSGFAALVSGLIVQKNAAGQLEHYNWVGWLAILLSFVAIWLGRKITSVDDA